MLEHGCDAADRIRKLELSSGDRCASLAIDQLEICAKRSRIKAAAVV